ncbi:hypothetical protein ENBRE01_1064 [Enteropsectra breve]|nr:hypothetical protein ENBRE01_1064 [Enteropsectra breve]
MAEVSKAFNGWTDKEASIFDTPEGNKRINKMLYTGIQTLLMVFLGLICLQLLFFIFFQEYYKHRSNYRGNDFLHDACSGYITQTIVMISPLIFAAGLLFVFSNSEDDFYTVIGRKLANSVQTIFAITGKICYVAITLAFCAYHVFIHRMYAYKIRFEPLSAIYIGVTIPLMASLVSNNSARRNVFLLIMIIQLICGIDSLIENEADLMLLHETLISFYKFDIVSFYDIELIKRIKAFLVQMAETYKRLEVDENIGHFFNYAKSNLEVQQVIYTFRNKWVCLYYTNLNYITHSASNKFKHAGALLTHNILFSKSWYFKSSTYLYYTLCTVLTVILIQIFSKKKQKNSIAHGLLQAVCISCIFFVGAWMFKNAFHYYSVLSIDRKLVNEDTVDILDALQDVYFTNEYKHTIYNFDYEFFNCLFYSIPSYMRRIENIFKARHNLISQPSYTAVKRNTAKSSWVY